MLNFLRRKKDSFTIVELLVVSSIIALIATVSLIYLNTAQKKSKDTRVVSDMDLFRKRANILFQINGNYTNLGGCIMSDSSPYCTGCTDPDTLKLCQDIGTNDSTTAGDNLKIFIGGTNDSTFCAYVHLRGSGNYRCVDNNLISKDYSSVPATCASGCSNCRCE